MLGILDLLLREIDEYSRELCCILWDRARGCSTRPMLTAATISELPKRIWRRFGRCTCGSLLARGAHGILALASMTKVGCVRYLEVTRLLDTQLSASRAVEAIAMTRREDNASHGLPIEAAADTRGHLPREAGLAALAQVPQPHRAILRTCCNQGITSLKDRRTGREAWGRCSFCASKRDREISRVHLKYDRMALSPMMGTQAGMPFSRDHHLRVPRRHAQDLTLMTTELCFHEELITFVQRRHSHFGEIRGPCPCA